MSENKYLHSQSQFIFSMKNYLIIGIKVVERVQTLFDFWSFPALIFKPHEKKKATPISPS